MHWWICIRFLVRVLFWFFFTLKANTIKEDLKDAPADAVLKLQSFNLFWTLFSFSGNKEQCRLYEPSALVETVAVDLVSVVKVYLSFVFVPLNFLQKISASIFHELRSELQYFSSLSLFFRSFPERLYFCVLTGSSWLPWCITNSFPALFAIISWETDGFKVRPVLDPPSRRVLLDSISRADAMILPLTLRVHFIFLPLASFCLSSASGFGRC